MKKEDAIKEFTKLEGIGKAKAEALYQAGYISVESLKKASVEDLVKVKGVTEALASKIKEQVGTEEKQPQQAEVKGKKEPEKVVGGKPEVEEKTGEHEESEEEKEEKYVSKAKPKLDNQKKRALRLRRRKKVKEPEFLRQEWFRYKRIKKHWRRPKGLHSKARRNLKYRPPLVRIGFRGPRDARGLHPSGFEEVLVYRIEDLDGVNPDSQAVRIGATVGTRKRLEIKTKADELGIRILNRGDL
ncbi:MAG TPA: 50S ribosomal protein L32e [Thermoplasmatales archaeon]|nr:50S ribosomal protein L32e [Thermoplasmatales archaeon]